MLLAARTYAEVLDAQVLRMTTLPLLTSSMPRSLPVQLFPSIRLSEPAALMPAPSPALSPLEVHWLSRIWQAMPRVMPSRVLKLATQPVTMHEVETEMPAQVLLAATHPVTVQLLFA